ncbi:endothelin-3b [Embiotoca jacksoni]|uniref:endothelin-3b n=1 Tax=Embiotoca jacksoni TaxID=100190 RepID=UPI003703F72E
MENILSIFARIMLFKILPFILLQGVLTSHALVKSEINPGGLTDSKAFGSRGPAGSPLSEITETKSRQKRCTCYSYKDKECVYYCHLDIIWINTPERTVPYGMSSYGGPQRSRRAAGGQPSEHEETKKPRCFCAVTDADPECHDFCLPSPPQAPPIMSLHRIPGLG